jgi:hypothetical protein
MKLPAASSGASKYLSHKANLAASCGELTPKEIRCIGNVTAKNLIPRGLQQAVHFNLKDAHLMFINIKLSDENHIFTIIKNISS